MTDAIRDGTTQGQLTLTRREMLAAAAAAAIAAACSPALPSGGGPTGGSTAPVRGGIARLPIFNEPFPLNPIISNELSSLLVRRSLYSYLTRLDPVSKRPVPDLAKTWEVSPNGLVWTFNLRDDVSWHDEMPFTAEDVKFTFEQILEPKNTSVERTNYLDMTKIEAIDKYTVRFTLKNPLMSLPVISGATVGIVPKHLLEGKDLRTATSFNNEKPIGTGPFKIVSVVPGSHVEMAAYDKFYRGKPFLDGVVWKIVPDVNARFAQLKAQELDYMTIEPSQLQGIQGDSRFTLTEYAAPEYTYFIPRHGTPIFSDKRVRQALVYGLNRQAILDVAALGKGTLMVGTIPPALKDWHNSALKPYPFDPAKAKSLLDEAGWTAGAGGMRAKGGTPLKFEISVDTTSAIRRQMAVLAQQMYRDIGMDASIKEVDRQIYSQMLQQKTFELNISNTPHSWDPDTQRRFYITNGGSNFGAYTNTKVDDLLNRGVQEVDVEKRKALYRELQEVMYEDVHVVHGYHPTELRVTSTKLKGLPDLPLRDVMTYMDTWWLEK